MSKMDILLNSIAIRICYLQIAICQIYREAYFSDLRVGTASWTSVRFLTFYLLVLGPLAVNLFIFRVSTTF